MLKFSVRQNLEGIVTFQKRGADGSIISGHPVKNLITDFGLNWLCGGAANPGGGWAVGSFWSGLGGRNRLVVGTGNSVPSYSDTACEAPVAGFTFPTNDSNLPQSHGNSGAPDYYTYMRVTCEFPLGAVVGNITEACITRQQPGSVSNNWPAITRVLNKDAEGNPVAFPVTAQEQLIVIYEIRSYPDLTDNTGTIDVEYINTPTPGIVSTDYISRVTRAQGYASNSSVFDGTSGVGRNLNSYFSGRDNWALGNLCAGQVATPWPVTTNEIMNTANMPLGAFAPCSTISPQPYVQDSFCRKVIGKWNANVANYAGGVGNIRIGDAGAGRWWAMFFDPPIMKTADDILEVVIDFHTGRA